MIYSYFINTFKHDHLQEKANCPFTENHLDKHASLYLSDEKGWYCFGCSEGGSPEEFIEKYLEISSDMASYINTYYEKNNHLPTPTNEEVEEYHRELLSQPAVIEYFSEHGVDIEVLKKYKIGWENNRIIFPIYSRRNRSFVINLRKYIPPGSARSKKTPKVIHLPNLGTPLYYPYEAFDEEDIVIVEGEKDCIVARAHGINAITSTGGSSFNENQLYLFKDKNVFVMSDSDETGDLIAKKYNEKLQGLAKTVKRIRLPEKDYSDSWVRNKDINIYDYETEFLSDEEIKNDIEIVDISEVYIPENANKDYKVTNMRVIGGHLDEYQIPYEFTVEADEVERVIEVDTRMMIGFIGSNDSAQEKYLKRVTGAKHINIKSKKEMNLQQVYFKEDINSFEVIEESGRDSMSGIYFYKDKPLSTNRVYDMLLLKTTEPKTQKTVFAIKEASECVIDTKIDLSLLEYFRKDVPLDILIDEYYDIWQPHLEVTGRKDLFTVMILTYLSVLEFNWRNSKIKGWLDTMIIGDTRTGKTKMIRNFMNTLGIGEYVSGENAKGTGIIGGIQQLGTAWSLNWGKIPLNDKRLVVIDEASGLGIEDITMLSQMRSEGILSITKIKSETTHARTRLLWISNPRSGEKINHYYWRGYEAIEEFLPVQEDLARFDLACSAASEDVDNIHDYSDREPMTEYEINRWRQLILFAWSLRKEDIEFSKGAYKKIIELSTELGEYFNGSPLFLKANGYEKLARVSISLAILKFNYIDGKIVVEEDHVEYAKQLYLDLYNKESFGLGAKATQHRTSSNAVIDNKGTIEKLFSLYDNLDILFRDGSMNQNMVGTILGLDSAEANRVIAQLYGLGLVTVSGKDSVVRPMPVFLDYIRLNEKEN